MCRMLSGHRDAVRAGCGRQRMREIHDNPLAVSDVANPTPAIDVIATNTPLAAGFTTQTTAPCVSMASTPET